MEREGNKGAGGIKEETKARKKEREEKENKEIKLPTKNHTVINEYGGVGETLYVTNPLNLARTNQAV